MEQKKMANEIKANDPWIIIEAMGKFDELLYTMAHMDVENESYAKVQYIKRVVEQYVELEDQPDQVFNEQVFMGHLLDTLHEMASCLETWIPKKDEE